ncbi:hypothetical protein DMC47_29895 [Nostoc sp. 3335mG]|nr:hypothetical protein DMC47_29895 [Nostoc sp. 3335mG]
MTSNLNGAAAPNTPHCTRRRRNLRLALLAGTAGLVALASPAMAQCVEGPPETFTCSGSTDIPQVLTGLDPVVVTTPGFRVDTTGNGNGIALQVSGDGIVSYTDLQASELKGAGVAFVSTGDNGLSNGGLTIFSDGAIVASGTQALRLENNGSGALNVVWTGAITSSGGNGISVVTGGSSAGASLSVSDIFSAGDGITIQGSGAGPLSLTATGTIASQTGKAVEIKQLAASAADIVVNLAAVVGGTEGIGIWNYGTAGVSVTVTGPVTVADGSGIRVVNGEDAGDITINVAGIQAGGGDGIYAVNQGSGNTRVTASGPVQSEAGLGMYIRNTKAAAGDLIVTSSEVHGATSGIDAEQAGSGDLIVTATGSVSGGAGVGVNAGNMVTSGNIIVATQEVSGDFRGISIANRGSGETLVTAAGAVTSLDGNGIAVDNDEPTTNLTILTTDVRGGYSAIRAVSDGSGFIRIVSSGSAIGDEGAGILVQGGAQTSSVSIDAATVTSSTGGIWVENHGIGATSISASGPVSGNGGTGVGFFTDGDTTDVSVRTADVSGLNGISGTHVGTGSVEITSTGTVTGAAGDGIALGIGGSGGDVLIDVVNVAGTETGVKVAHSGTGFIRLRATGAVSGAIENGIDLNTEVSTGSVRIEANAVSGGEDGILVTHRGSGTLGVFATGPVSGALDGIDLSTDALGEGIMVQVAGVTGGSTGIRTANSGTGTTLIEATGPVIGGDGVGINVVNAATATDLRIVAVDVRGTNAGMVASNGGTGGVAIVSMGTIEATGPGGTGLSAFAGPSATGVDMEVTNARGAAAGISTFNSGTGDTVIQVGGVVQGDIQAIRAETSGGGDIRIVNDGTIRNSSGAAFRAITASGARIIVGNMGSLLGSVDLSGTESLMGNAGTWNGSGGTSLFSGANDELANFVPGVILGGSAGAVAETTSWTGLERFTNLGRIDLRDGGIGDRIQTSATTSFSAGSVLAVDIGGATGSDSYRTTGSLEIEPGSLLLVNRVQPLTLYGKHVVVEAMGGLTGTFDFADQFLTAFAGLRDGYDATTAFVEFAQLRDLADAGLTPNQKETAAGADGLVDGNPVKDALLLLPTDAAAQAAFDKLSGEIHPAMRAVLAEDSRLPRNAVLTRLSDDQPGGSVWGQAFGNWGTSDGDRNAAEVGRDTTGLLIGADIAVGDTLTLGLAGGYLDTDVRLDARNSSGSARTIHGLAYVGARFGGFGIKAGFGYARADIDTRRIVSFQGFAGTLNADYDGTLLQGFAEIGYRLPLGGGEVEPFASIAQLRVTTDALTESGGAAALSVAQAREDSTISTLGLRFRTASAGAFSIGGAIGWQHGFGTLDPVGRNRFTGGDPFTILGAGQSRDAGIVNVDARLRLAPAITLGVSYDGVLGTSGQDHAVKGAFRIAF